MPQASQSVDLDLTGLVKPASTPPPASAPSAGALDLSGLVKPSSDQRSVVARAIDTASTPLVPQLATGARSLADVMTTPHLDESQLSAMLRGGAAGVVQGTGDLLASFTSPLGIAAALSGLGAEKAGAAGFVNAARALRATEAATGAAFAERGLEQAAEAPDLAGKALGVAQAAGGALGVRGGVVGLRGRPVITPEVLPPDVRQVSGALGPGPSFIIDASGRVAPFGTEIPPEVVPDRSFVRGVPAEYARREVRGALPPVRGFVADAAGNVVPAEHALDLSGLVQAPQTATPATAPSFVRSVPAVPTSYTAESGRVVPATFSGDVNAAPSPQVQMDPKTAYALAWIRQDMDAIPYSSKNFNPAGRGRGGDLEVSGGSAGAPIYRAIVGEERFGVSGASRADVLRAIDNLEQGKLTKTGDLVLGVARQLADGDRRVQRLMATPPPDITPADRLATGELQPRLPGDVGDVRAQEATLPDVAAVPFSLTPEAATRTPAQPSLLGSGLPPAAGAVHPEVNPLDAALADESLRSPTATGGREPGEEGAIDPVLAARLGLGGAGAVYGGATGDTPEDRIKRALLFGAAGAFAPSLLARGGSAAAGPMSRFEGRARFGAGADVQAASEPRRLFTPKPEAMPSSPITPARLMPPEQKLGADWLNKYTPDLRTPIAHTFAEYEGFEAQRRGVVPDARVEGLAQRIAVDMAQARPGSIANVEESRAMANATSTLFDRMKAARVQLGEAQAKGDASAVEARQAVLAKLYQDGAVMLGNVRANASEQGRALRGQQLINQVLQSYDERIIGEAVKRLRPEQLKLFTDQLAKLPDDPQAFYQLLQSHLQAQRGPSDQLFAYLYNNVLSGPATFVKNVLGTGQNALFQGASNLVAGALDARKPLEQRAVLLSEPAAAATATVDGLFRGGKAALFILQHGYDPLAVERGAIPPMFTELPGGPVTNWPTRLTRAVHGVFYQEAARSFESTSIAYTQAAKEIARSRPRLTGKALADAIAERTSQLAATPEIQAQAAQYAARTTFTEDMGPVGRAFGQLLNSSKALRFVQLFYKIPFNITKQQLRSNTLLAFIPQLGETDISAGGRVGAQAQARALLGTAVLSPLAAMVVAGRVTGNGPTGPRKRSLWLQTHPLNSVRVGDHWIDYRSLPVATPLAMLANIYEAYQDGLGKDADLSQALSAVVARLGNVITSQPFLAGIKNFIDAMEAPAGRASAMLKSTAQMFVPASGLLRGITRATDPTIRRVESPLDAVKEITPGLSTTLQPRVDLFGAPIAREGSPLARGFLPPEASPVPVKADPVVALLERLQIAPGIPGAQVRRRGVPLPLTPDQQTAVREAIGQMRRTSIERLMNNPRFDTLSPKVQADLVKRAISHATTHVEARVKGRFGAHLPITADLLVTPPTITEAQP